MIKSKKKPAPMKPRLTPVKAKPPHVLRNHMVIMFITSLIVALFASAIITNAHASQLSYHGNNPDISPSANPNNEAGIASMANLTKPKNTKTPSGALSDAEVLRQGALSAISSFNQQLLTSNGNINGSLNFGDGSVADYTTTGNIRTVVFRNTITGQSTTISFPIN